MSFTVEIDEDIEYIDVKLEYKTKDGLCILFMPEDAESMKDLDVEANSGTFGGEGSNGEFYLSWSSKAIEFGSSRYGSNASGGLRTTIRDPSEEIMRSFKKCLAEWKEAALRLKP